MKEVSWGFIGCGNVVKNKSGGAFNSVDGSSICAVYSRSEESAKYVSSMFQVPYWYTSVGELLSNKSVSAVYIATPPGLHLKHALACCQASKPIYIEKPFARNVKEAEIIVDTFRKNNIPVYVAHYFRAQPRFRFVKEILSKKVIGDPVNMSFSLERQYEPLNWHYTPKLSGGGRFYDIAPHSLDLIQYLFGRFVDIYGFARNCNKNYQVEDTVMITFETESGVAGTANYNLQSNCKKDEMIILGTSGKLSFSVHNGEDVRVETATGIKIYSFAKPLWDAHYMVQEVVNALLGKDNHALTGEEALNTMKAMDAVLQDFYHGRDDCFWERPNTWG